MCKVGRHEMRLAQPRGGLAVPLKEMKLLNAQASGALKDCFFSSFCKTKSYKEELFEVLLHLHFTGTVSAEISPTEVPLFFPPFTFLFVCLF